MEIDRGLRLLRDGCEDLGYRCARAAFEDMLSEAAESHVASAFLIALQAKGETEQELLGGIDAVRSRQVAFEVNEDGVDVGGTGGDSGRTFNVSTTAAFVVAAAGARVYKHGSRAVSGLCGSVDLAERLGLPTAPDPVSARDHVARYGIAILPSHSFLRYPPLVTVVRRTLRVRTAFNLIGPWCNPARVRRQVIGVSDQRYVPVFAGVARALGHECAMIVHGRDGGLDEFSPAGPSFVAEVRRGHTVAYERSLTEFGLENAPLETVSGGGADVNARFTLAILSGDDRGPRRSLVLLTAGAALYAGNSVVTMADGVRLAADTIDSGRATTLIRRMQVRVVPTVLADRSTT